MIIVNLSFMFPDNTSDLRTHLLQQRYGGFKTCSRIMIACHNYQLQLRILFRHLPYKMIKHTLGCRGRIGNIKDISRNQ